MRATDEHLVTSLDSQQNPWWQVFRDVFRVRRIAVQSSRQEADLVVHDAQDIDIPLEPEIFPAATDSRYLRQLKLPALGFSPIRNTPILLHDHNEYLHEDVFLEGIEVMVAVIRALSSAGGFQGESES